MKIEINCGAMENDLCKTDAISEAHTLSHKVSHPVYAVETKWGWTIAKNKPSLRFGKVFECCEGREVFA